LTSHSAKRVVSSAGVYSRAWIDANTTIGALFGRLALVAELVRRSTFMS
jgi:hypothetical protein